MRSPIVITAGVAVAVVLAGCASTAGPGRSPASAVRTVITVSTLGRPPSTMRTPSAPPSEPPTPPVPAIARRYGWADGDNSLLTGGACLLAVHGVAPSTVLRALTHNGTARQVTRTLPINTAQRLADRRNVTGSAHAYSIVGVSTRRGWTLVLEDNGFMCTDVPTLRALTVTGTTAVSLYSNPAGGDYFRYARSGRLVRAFEPDVYADDEDTTPLPQERGLPFQTSVHSFALTMVLVQRLTGFAFRSTDVTMTGYRSGIVTRY